MFIELKDPEAGLFPPARLAEILASALFFLGERLAQENSDGTCPRFNPKSMRVSRIQPDGLSVAVSGWDTHEQMIVMLEQSEEATVPSPVRVFVRPVVWDDFLIPLEQSVYGFMAKKHA